MSVNYLYDESGHTTHAIIPIREWERLQAALLAGQSPASAAPFDPTLFRGILRELNLDIEAELTNMREQWG